jgi:hypothetical protein
LNVDHAQLREIIYTGAKTRHRKSNLRNKGQYHLSSEKHVIMIINYTEKSGILPMSVIKIFSASKTFFFAEMMCKQLMFCERAATRLYDVVEWSRALDVRLSEWCYSVSMVWVQIPSREEQKFDSSKI